MTETMRALVGGVGPDWELREVEVPSPAPGQLLVRVRAAALNRADLYMLEGSYKPNTKTGNVYTAGLELAGEVEAVGEGVQSPSAGDRVMGSTLGAFAPFAVLDHRHAIRVPAGLGWSEAAALPVGLSTAHDALVTQAGFTAGDSVLVTGASSSMGLLAIQLAKALGAGLVIGTTTSAEKAQGIAAAGADVVINTAVEGLAARVTEVTGAAGIDIALDHVGGQLFAELLPATRIGGMIVNIGRLAGAECTINLDQLAFRRMRIRGTTFSVRTAEERGEVCAALVGEVIPAVEDRRIEAIIDRVFPFADAHLAAARMRSNEAAGKIVLTMPDPQATTDTGQKEHE
ncbi:MAG TPA: zinc-binding dehydrogenase [Solirubrobacteraceae bacterium]|nr:zinc-binding dehydrogenase [Solirubrobacteraceae bacterium]